MADAGVSVVPPTVSSDLFWCHQCRAEIHPIMPDYTCPQCSGGFVEPVQENHRSGTGRLSGSRDFPSAMDFDMDSLGDDDDYEDDDDDDGPAAQMAYADFSRLLRTLIRGVPVGFDEDPIGVRVRIRGGGGERGSRSGSGSTPTTPGASSTNVAAPQGESNSMSTEIPDNDAAAAAQAQAQPQGGVSGSSNEPNSSSQQQRSQRQNRGQRGQRRRRRGHAAGFLPLEDILEQMFTSSFGGPGSGGYFISGNPGDYAFGPRGLDDIITQLLNQYEGGGPAPAKEDEIASLTKDKITEKDVAANAQCPVCFDEYELGQEVKRLACKHAFHEDCIVPWLKIHGTCPVCRSDLQGQAPPSPTPKEGVSSSESPFSSSLFNLDQPGPSGTQQPSRPSQPLPRTQQQRSNPIGYSRGVFRPNIYLGPNAGGGSRNRGQQQNRSSSNSGGGHGASSNSNNNRGGRTGGAGSGNNNSSSSSYLDQVD